MNKYSLAGIWPRPLLSFALQVLTAIPLLVQAAVAAPDSKPPAFNQADGLWLCDSDCAKNIFKYSTIGIETPGSSGSAVVIGLKDGVYTALTAAHVMKGYSFKEDYYAVSLPYNKRYRIISTVLPANGRADIALVQFKAGELLYIQPLNIFIDAPSTVGMTMTEWGVDGDGARSAGISLPSGAVSVPILRFNEFTTQSRAEGNKDGYEFLYNASTVPGMSGGPIVGWRVACNKKDEGYKAAGYFSLLAIHGRSEEYAGGGRSGLSLAVPIDLIKTYLRDNATALGIPSNNDEVNAVELRQYCPLF